MSKKLSVQEKARRIWQRALRSKKYGWGRKALHPEPNKFCCLGVLCEVAIKHGIINKYDPNDALLINYPKVMEWVGIRDDNGSFGNETLAGINDESKRNPFKKIANIIGRKPSGLFVEEKE